MSSKARDDTKDFNLSSTGNHHPHDIWSDGTTMWVADEADDKIYAYNMSTKAHDSTKDFNIFGTGWNSYGLWSDGTTMWVSDMAKIYAYNLSTKERTP